jgi:hypothetical protein
VTRQIRTGQADAFVGLNRIDLSIYIAYWVAFHGVPRPLDMFSDGVQSDWVAWDVGPLR